MTTRRKPERKYFAASAPKAPPKAKPPAAARPDENPPPVKPSRRPPLAPPAPVPRVEQPGPAPRPEKGARSAGLNVRIARLDDDGIAIARHEGKDIHVAGALPGEEVAVSIEAKGQLRWIGRLRKVLTPHPRRVAGRCRDLPACLGCPLIGLADEAQLEYKQLKVRAALSAYEVLRGNEIAPVWAAPQTLGYRTTAKLVFGRKRGQVQLGLFRRGTHEVVDLPACPLHHPLINRIAAVVREEVTRQGIYVYDPLKQRGLLRYLLVRVSPESGRAMVTFVVAEKDFRQLNSLAKWLQRKVPEIVSVQQNINPTSGNVILGRETLRLLGESELFDRVGTVRLQLAPASFFQVNHAQAARIYALVREWAALTRDEVAVDLYCGIGGITLHLAQDAGRVVGVETVEEAVKNARTNARLNGLDNCTFLAGAAEELVEELALEVERAAVVVLNPPRGGCAAEVLAAAVALAPRTLIYVSCNPETLARDLAALHGLGYGVAQVQPVDMFPQTAHVETVVRLEPLPRPVAAGAGERSGKRARSR